MALKARLTQGEYDGLDAGLRGAYVADGDDGYRLDLDPDATASTPAPAADDDRLAKLETMVSALVNRKPDKAKPADADLTVRVAELENQLQQEREATRTEKANAAISREAGKLGVLPGAIEDVLSRATAAGFVLADDGSVSTESGTTIRAYVEGLRKTSAHLFRQPTGSQQPALHGGQRVAPKTTLQADDMNEETLLANLDKLGGEVEIVDAVN